MRARDALFHGISYVLCRPLNNDFTQAALSVFSLPELIASPTQVRLSLWLRTTGLCIAASTAFFLLFVNGFWSYLDGRFFHDAAALRYNFLEDVPNIINYLVICPAYVVLCVYFLANIYRLRDDLARSGFTGLLHINMRNNERSSVRISFVVLFCIAAGSILLSHYAAEIDRYDHAFWFQSIAQGDVKRLGPHGYYYIFTNLFLNLLVVFTTTAHFELFAVAAIVGKGIRRNIQNHARVREEAFDKDHVLRAFTPYSSLYAVSKAIVFVLFLNLYTWQAQEPNFVGMLDVSIAIMFVLGSILISYPRYYVQYWMYQLWKEHGRLEYVDMRSPLVRGWASIVDIVLVGGAMANLMFHALQRLGLSVNVMTFLKSLG